MMKFSSRLSCDLVLKCKDAMLNNDMDISRLVVYIQQVEDKKKLAEIGERQNIKFKYSEQGSG